ncbi:MAG: LysM peptidoglycan-binding domain-containing protein [Bacteroidota bacterium]
MPINIKNIVFVISMLTTFSGRLFAQEQSFPQEYWLVAYPELSFEYEVLASIERLKQSETILEDSSTIAILDSIGYLAIAQSGFKGSAADVNQRTGWWLLNYPVAVRYGLLVNHTIDERMDLAKSTQAAFRYRQDLIAIYGAEMVDLAFIVSPLAMQKFLKDSLNFPEEYEQIKKASARIEIIRELFIDNKNDYSTESTKEWVKVTSDQSISFEILHQFLQIPTSELKAMNPQWISGIYNPVYGQLFIPSSVAEIFAQKQIEMEQKTKNDAILLAAANEKRVKQLKGNIPDLNIYEPISYKIKRGDNLGKIAQRHHVYISNIREWNNLRSDRIYAGQRLTIYVPKNKKFRPTPVVEKKTKSKTLEPGTYDEYTVRQGDTLWAISQKYEHVSIENIMADNGIDENISPGQVLKIRKQ